MNTVKTKAFFLLLFIVFISSTLFSVPHCSAKIYKGKCGPDAHWIADTDSHTLTVTGKGVINGTLGNAKIALGYAKKKDSDAISIKDIKYHYKIKKIIITEGITSLDCYLLIPSNYGYCTSRKERILVKLPNSLKTIKRFESEDSMNFDITIPKNVKNISPRAFTFEGDCKSIVKVANDNPYFRTIDNIIFSKDKKTLVYYPANIKKRKYVVPKSVRKIAPLAFMENVWLKRVILPDHLKKLGSGAFFKCVSLRYVYLSNKMKIKNITDYDTKGEWQADTPQSYDTYDEGDVNLYVKKVFYDRRYDATEMRAGTFEGTSVRSIIIPDSVEYISSNTFFANDYRTFTMVQKIKFGKNFSGNINLGESHDGMKTLTLNGSRTLKIRISKKNKKYCMENGILYNKDKTVLHLVTAECKEKTLYIPESVKTIANGAFMGNETIRHVVVSGDLTSIGYNAFLQSKIKSFTCYGKIKTIKQNAFADCDDLEKFEAQEIGKILTRAFTGDTPIGKKDIVYNENIAANVENTSQNPLPLLTISKSCQPMMFALYTRFCILGK